MAGPATTTSGKRLTFNNMQGTPMALPLTMAIGPGEELELRVDLQMMAGMGGPHRFHLPVWIEEEQQPMHLYIQGMFR